MVTVMDTVTRNELERPRKRSTRVRMALLRWLIGGVGGVGLITLGLMHDTPTPAGVVPGPATAQSDTIELVTAAVPQPFVAGGEVPIATDVIGTVAIDQATGETRYSRSTMRQSI
jgi:hypothetical protein